MRQREEYRKSKLDKKFLTLEQARAKRLNIAFTQDQIVKPNLIGSLTLEKYDLKKLVDFIDWDPFFQLWQLRGKYPNRGYPKLFKDKDVGEEAQKLFAKAQTMLSEIVDNNLIEARGIVGFYPAN